MSRHEALEYRHPVAGMAGRCVEAVLGSRKVRALRRAVFSRLLFVPLRSDVVDVVYCTWMVDIAVAQALAPEQVALVDMDGRTPFTILTYRHGHFGPAWLGPLRTLTPSPLQSNWRLYVAEVHGAPMREPTVCFVRNMMDSLLYTVGTRLFSDALPTQLPTRFTHVRDSGAYRTRIDPGRGGAESFACDAVVDAAPVLPAPFASAFGDWSSAVRWLTMQDAAVVAMPDDARLASARISLPVALDTVIPLRVEHVESGFFARFGGLREPLCFALPHVDFRVLDECVLPIPVP